jgi:hypothetical protein
LHCDSHSASCATSFAALFCRLRLHHWCNNQRKAEQRLRKRQSPAGASAVNKKLGRLNATVL